MSVGTIAHSGAIEIYKVIDGYLTTRSYYGYSKYEAIESYAEEFGLDLEELLEEEGLDRTELLQEQELQFAEEEEEEN
jgi:hypothetical protein